MSYYMGDYYRGDPGIGSFFGGLFKKVAGVASSFIPGIGPAVSGAIEKIGGSSAGKVVKVAGAQIIKHPVLSAAAAAGAGATMGAVGEHMIAPGTMGHHKKRPLKKCGMPLKSGRVGKCYRSMNVCNPHALRRAIRRARGFTKLAMRTIHLVHPKKKGRFGGFKKRRRAA